jgi:hypothetical protein
MHRPASTGALLRLRDDGTPRRNEIEIVMDPLFEDASLRSDLRLLDDTKEKLKEADDVLFFSPMSSSQYTFTWRGCKSRVFSENQAGSVALCLLSVSLFALYYLHRNDEFIHLNNGTFFDIFAIHYSIGIFVGFVIIILIFQFRQRLPPESLILFACVLFSHYPDILAMVHGFSHQPWMNIFFLHTWADQWFPYCWLPLFILDGSMIFLYVKMIEESRPKTSTRNLVALL